MGVRLFQIDMQERQDRHGQKYLVGPIPELDLVAFVFDDTEPGDAEKHFTFVVKPYSDKTEKKAPAGGDSWSG